MMDEQKEYNGCTLDIVYLPPDTLTPYVNNARKHSAADVEKIKNSILEFGFSDPIGIYGENNIIVEGHGRQMAALALGLKEVPCIRLDHMTDEQRKAYTLAHNKTALLSSWDYKMLDAEISSIRERGINMDLFGFDLGGLASNDTNRGVGESYSGKVIQYTPTMNDVDIGECFDATKYEQMLRVIDAAELPDDEKHFLALAASRHIVFNYKVIAEYYANASPQMQALMEASALVIIDLNDAIENGYAVLREELIDIAYGEE